MPSSVTMRKSGDTGRAGADVPALENTLGNDILMGTDSKQLSTLASVEDMDYFLQNEFVMREGTEITEKVPSYQPSMINKLDSTNVKKVFTVKEPIITVCPHASGLAVVNHAVQVLTEMLPTVGKFSLVLFEDVPEETDVFLNKALAMHDKVR